MAGTVADFEALVSQDGLAASISEKYDSWNNLRDTWIAEQAELQRYLFATSTMDTSAGEADNWRNKTTLPKLTQIRDNLHANYMASLFPSDDWMRWEGHSFDDVAKEKAIAIEAYVQTKTSDSDFRNTVSQLVYDYIDYGNCFAEVTYVREFSTDDDGSSIPGYIGPKLLRNSPYDIVFNPTAASYFDSPKITRSIMSIGELRLAMEENPDDKTWIVEALTRQEDLRKASSGLSPADSDKATAYMVDGFGSYQEYLESGLVEILQFTGDAYDPDEDKMIKDQVITVIDRSRVVRMQDNPSWLRKRTMFHSAWRKRPDNLYGMGPLHNLVGLQYRMDHLENLKADIFDMIATPPIVIQGDVAPFDWGPGEEIHIDSVEGGAVGFLSPPTEALSAEFQIDKIEVRMEAFAGAPREALGIRTPGEKTAFEVQQLQNASARIFQQKIEQFERDILEPVINAFLEQGRRHMDTNDIARSVDTKTGAVAFLAITKEEITARGVLRPMGARHFAVQSQLIQTLSTLFSSGVAQVILPHTSGIKLTKLLEDVLKLQTHELFSENVAVQEEIERQKLAQQGQGEVDAEQGLTPEELLAQGIQPEAPDAEELPEAP